MIKIKDGKKLKSVEPVTAAIEPREEPRERHEPAVGAFVRDHPLLVIAGGLTAGLIIGALIPRRTGKAIVKRTSALSEIAAAAALSLGRDAADRASDAGEVVRKGGHVLADRAEDWAVLALKGASAFARSAADNIGKLGASAAEKAEELGETAVDRIGKTSQQASKRIEQAVPVAEATAARAGKRLGDAIAQLREHLKG